MFQKLLKEPLVHFLVLGAVIFFIFRVMGDPAANKADRIVITSGILDQLIQGFTRTWQRPPTEQELKGLIKDYVKEEIYYREGVAMRLDRDDTIVRRRLAQKVEFLSDDLMPIPPPTEKDLQNFLRLHPDKFRRDTKISFDQIYFNPEHRQNAASDAQQLLQRLSKTTEPVDPEKFGDLFLLPADQNLLRRDEIERRFGHQFADDLIKLKPNEWSGPVKSGYGLHLVFIRERIDAHMPKLSEVREAVQREWTADQRAKAKAAFYQQLRDRYKVSIELPNQSNGIAKLDHSK